MAKTPFKLKSGNTTPFKQMGSSPLKISKMGDKLQGLGIAIGMPLAIMEGMKMQQGGKGKVEKEEQEDSPHGYKDSPNKKEEGPLDKAQKMWKKGLLGIGAIAGLGMLGDKLSK